MRLCFVCGKAYTNPGTRCNSCRSKAWKVKNRQRDLAQRRAYNKRRWEKVKPIHAEKHCRLCGKVFMPNRFTPKQPFCSAECRLNAYKDKRREVGENWRKNNPKRYKELKKGWDSRHHDKTRFNGNRIKALERDGHKCVDCGSAFGNLNVHHEDLSGQTDNPNNELDNLTTLCAACHLRRHEHWLNTIRATK